MTPTRVDRRKVLHIIDSWGPGGAESVFVELVAGLDEHRWEGHSVVPREGWVLEALARRGCLPEIVASDGRFNLDYLLRLVRLIRSHHVDLVQTHLFGASVYGSMAGIVTGVPVVCALHGSPDLDSAGRLMGLKYQVLRMGASRVICVSNGLAREFHSRVPYPPDRVTVIHNGISLETFRPGLEPSIRTDFGVAPEDILVGTVANLRPAKALDVFVQAAALIAKEEPRARFVIVGDTDEVIFPQLQAMSRSLGLEDKLSFAGFREDIERVIRGFNAFVCSSDTEGFSLATVQAMASGVPVVATRSGGPEEIIRHRTDGILVDRRSPPQIAEAVLSVIRGDPEVAHLAKNALDRVRDRFSIQAMLRGYEDIYDELLR